MALQSFFRKQFTLLNFEFIHEWIHSMQYYVFIFFLDQLILSMRDMVRRNKAINLLHPQNRNTLSSLSVQKPSCYFRTFEKYIFFEIELLLLLSKSCKMHEPVICYPFMHFGNLWVKLCQVSWKKGKMVEIFGYPLQEMELHGYISDQIPDPNIIIMDLIKNHVEMK